MASAGTRCMNFAIDGSNFCKYCTVRCVVPPPVSPRDDIVADPPDDATPWDERGQLSPRSAPSDKEVQPGTMDLSVFTGLPDHPIEWATASSGHGLTSEDVAMLPVNNDLDLTFHGGMRSIERGITYQEIKRTYLCGVTRRRESWRGRRYDSWIRVLKDAGYGLPVLYVHPKGDPSRIITCYRPVEHLSPENRRILAAREGWRLEEWDPETPLELEIQSLLSRRGSLTSTTLLYLVAGRTCCARMGRGGRSMFVRRPSTVQLRMKLARE